MVGRHRGREGLDRPAARIGAAAFAKSGVVMGPDFARLAANLGRNFMEGRLGILTAVFEAA
jgi:hypothetical protein